MQVQKFNLWENTPGKCEEIPTMTYYKPENKTVSCAVVIFPGGGYGARASHEGKGYAEFLSQNGISAFVVITEFILIPSRCRCLMPEEASDMLDTMRKNSA